MTVKNLRPFRISLPVENGTAFRYNRIMKIILVRHAKVNMSALPRYTSGGYDEMRREYDRADICPVTEKKLDTKGRPVYVSTLRRSADTAVRLFESPSVTATELLDEVPLRSYKDTDKLLSKTRFDVMGRLQWYFGDPRQPESRRATEERARQFIELLERRDEDAIVVTHSLFMTVLLKQFEKQRYEIKRSSVFLIAPLERISVSAKVPHCGNCAFNCTLANAGCMIGQDKARQYYGRKKTDA